MKPKTPKPILMDLGDYRVIRYDRMNLALESKTPKGNWKHEWPYGGFYTTIEGLLRALPDHLLLHPDVITIKDLKWRWDALRHSLEENGR